MIGVLIAAALGGLVVAALGSTKEERPSESSFFAEQQGARELPPPSPATTVSDEEAEELFGALRETLGGAEAARDEFLLAVRQLTMTQTPPGSPKLTRQQKLKRAREAYARALAAENQRPARLRHSPFEVRQRLCDQARAQVPLREIPALEAILEEIFAPV